MANYKIATREGDEHIEATRFDFGDGFIKFFDGGGRVVAVFNCGEVVSVQETGRDQVLAKGAA